MDQGRKTLSFIIPVYKVEQFLNRCFKSLDEQDSDNCEFIFVDDGSPDESGKMLDAYVKMHPTNVKVIHKENGGLSDARNAGMRIANGKYCVFWDSDDSLVPEACKKITEILGKDDLDVLYLDTYWTYQSGFFQRGKRGFLPNYTLPGIEALSQELRGGKYAAMAQLGVYRTDFLRKHDLYFKKGILHEDEHWSPRVMLCAEKIMRIEYAYYNYFIRENSITQSCNAKRYYDLIDTVHELRTIYANCGNEEVEQYGRQYLAKLYMNAAAHLIVAGEEYQPDASLYRNGMIGAKNKLKAILFEASPKLFLRLMGN